MNTREALEKLVKSLKEMKEEVDREYLQKKYEGFKAVEESASKSGASDPAAVAAAVGMKKYGKRKFEEAAHEGKKLKKGLLGASAPAAPKSAFKPKDKSAMAGVGAAPKSPAAAFGGKNDLNKPAAPAVAKSDDLEKSGVVVIEGSKKVAKKDSMMKMVGYMKGKK